MAHIGCAKHYGPNTRRSAGPDDTGGAHMSDDQLDALIEDLIEEQNALDGVVGSLRDDQWDLPTPSPGWTVSHQIAHLTYFDLAAAMAVSEPERFLATRDELFAEAMARPDALDEITLADYLLLSPAELLAAWRDGRAQLATAASTLGTGDRVEWFGPSMSGRSFLTARLMEVWAHGQDVIDAVVDSGGTAGRQASERLRHIAHLGFVTRGWSYSVRDAEAPEADVRVELLSPAGETWTWGPESAEESVRGPAEDFCLVVTQRRHPGDTELEIEGDAATDWMIVAQAFAGGATEGPKRRS